MYVHTHGTACAYGCMSPTINFGKEKKKCRPQNGSPLFIFLLHLVALVTHTHIQTTGKRRRKFGFNWSG